MQLSSCIHCFRKQWPTQFPYSTPTVRASHVEQSAYTGSQRFRSTRCRLGRQRRPDVRLSSSGIHPTGANPLNTDLRRASAVSFPRLRKNASPAKGKRTVLPTVGRILQRAPAAATYFFAGP